MKVQKICQKPSPRKVKMTGVSGKTNQKKFTSSKIEHPLIVAFSDSINKTNEEIKARVDSTLATVSAEFRTRLGDIQQHSLKSYQSTEAKESIITRPTDETLLKWESVDKLRSGETTLKSRIRKLEKILNIEEASIGHEMEQLHQVNVELDHLVTKILGTANKDNRTLTELEVSIRNSQHQISSKASGVPLNLEAETSEWLDTIETTNKAAMQKMNESEKVIPDQ